MSGRIARVVEQLWLPIGLVVLWFLVSAQSTNPYFPPLSEIIGAFWRRVETGRFFTDFQASLVNLAAGLGLGILIGAVAGILIGRSVRLRVVLSPFLEFCRAVPQVALVPVVIGALGITAGPKIWTIALATLWPVLLNTMDGVRAIDPAVRDMVRAFRIPERVALARVVLPASLPQMAAGIRISLSIGVVIVVVSEIYGAAIGLGYYINQSGSTFDVPSTWAGTLVIGVLGYLLNVVFVIVEKSTLRWYFESAA